MDDQPEPVSPGKAQTDPRAEWQVPTIKRMNAGDAENGFRGGNDGAFTTS